MKIGRHRDMTIEQIECEYGADVAAIHRDLRVSRAQLVRTGPLAEIRGCGRISDERYRGGGLLFCVLPLGHEPGDFHAYVPLPPGVPR